MEQYFSPKQKICLPADHRLARSKYDFYAVLPTDDLQRRSDTLFCTAHLKPYTLYVYSCESFECRIERSYQTISISRGVLRLATQNEILCLIGHEIGEVKLLSVDYSRKLDLERNLASRDYYAYEDFAYPPSQETMRAYRAFRIATAKTSAKFRVKEFLADAFGALLASRVDSINLLRKLGTFDWTFPEDTHPSNRERIAILEEGVYFEAVRPLFDRHISKVAKANIRRIICNLEVT
jgi:hypothetical protein